MNIFRSLGRAASKAARAIKPKRIHGPKHGAKAFLKKHAKLAAILGAGVGVGAGAEGLIELAKGKSEEEPPIIMLGGELSEHKTTDDSWNFLRFDTENDNFSEEKTILDIQTTDPPPPNLPHPNPPLLDPLPRDPPFPPTPDPPTPEPPPPQPPRW